MDGVPVEKIIGVILQGGQTGMIALLLYMLVTERRAGKEKDEIIAGQYKSIVDLTRESVGGLANATNAVVAIDKSIGRVEALVVSIQSVFASHSSRK